MTNVERALEFAVVGQFSDGSAHKQWAIDQIVRALTDCPIIQLRGMRPDGTVYDYGVQGTSEEYKKFVEKACRDDEANGEFVYTWETGIAP